MALELIVVQGLFVLLLASLLFAHFSGLKIFWIAGFILLMFGGLLAFSNGGIITNHYYDVDGVYSSTVLVTSSGIGFLLASICFWSGLILTVWGVFFTSMFQASGQVSKVFVWD